LARRPDGPFRADGPDGTADPPATDSGSVLSALLTTLPGCHMGTTFLARAGCPVPAGSGGDDPRGRRRLRTGPAMGNDGATMTVFLVLLIPLLLMVFALLMERLERRLKTATVSEADVQEFLDTAKPEEVNTFIREGWTKAFAKFRLRRRPRLRRRHRDGVKDAGAADV
jgi:hypothetical protein